MQTQAATRDPVAPPSRRTVRRLVVSAVALGLLAGLLLLWQWRSPEVFDEGFGLLYEDKDWPVGEPIYLGITQEPHGARGSIEIHGAEPDIVQDNAGVRIDYLLCVVEPSSGVGSIGSVTSTDIDEQCSSLTPVEGQDMELNADPRQQVVVSVTATQPGTVEIGGTELSYSYGWRRGSQFLGEGLVLTAVS